MYDLVELKNKIETKLNKCLPTSVFLDRFRVIDEESRKTAQYGDSRYFPFYYWLGTLVQPKNLVEIGLHLGLCSGMLLKACKTVKEVLTFQQKTDQFFSPRLGRSNIKDHFKGILHVHVGDVTDDYFTDRLDSTGWDIALVNEDTGYDKYLVYLDVVWSKLNAEGLIVMDNVTRTKAAAQAFSDFCKTKNRTPLVIETRYGVGMVHK